MILRAFLPSASITHIAGGSPVFARQKAVDLPSGDSLAEIPDRWITMRQDGDASIAHFGLQISVPPRASSGLKSRLKWSTSGAVAGIPREPLIPAGDEEKGLSHRESTPGRSPTAPRLRVAVSCREPHGLPAGEHAAFAAIGATDAYVGPVMPGIVAITAVDVENPAPIGGPARAEIEVPCLCCDADPVFAFRVAGPDLVSLRTCEMERDPRAVGTERKAIGKSLTCACELAGVGPIESNTEDLTDLVAHHLYQNAAVSEQQGRRHERSYAILGTDFFQRTALEVMNPYVRRSLGVVLLERPAGTVAPRLHAQKDHAPPVRESPPWLPARLTGFVEVKVFEAGSVGDLRGLSCLGK